MIETKTCLKRSSLMALECFKSRLVIMMSFWADKFKSNFASIDLKNGFSFNAF
ncbi:hypothetical protein [Campylobacter curvus]|uniref:hypothetical protein n=1 Tax=Campylobacter curvus TaxID=200 RepID=UPI00146FCF20|nr:hypothetical protein [Campylobacter curvus]